MTTYSLHRNYSIGFAIPVAANRRVSTASRIIGARGARRRTCGKCLIIAATRCVWREAVQRTNLCISPHRHGALRNRTVVDDDIEQRNLLGHGFGAREVPDELPRR